MPRRIISDMRKRLALQHKLASAAKTANPMICNLLIKGCLRHGTVALTSVGKQWPHVHSDNKWLNSAIHGLNMLIHIQQGFSTLCSVNHRPLLQTYSKDTGKIQSSFSWPRALSPETWGMSLEPRAMNHYPLLIDWLMNDIKYYPKNSWRLGLGIIQGNFQELFENDLYLYHARYTMNPEWY